MREGEVEGKVKHKEGTRERKRIKVGIHLSGQPRARPPPFFPLPFSTSLVFFDYWVHFKAMPCLS